MAGKTFALFTAFYPPHMGGVESFSYNLAHELESMGNRVVVITNDTPHGEYYEVQGCVIEVFRLPCLSIMGDRYPIPQMNAVFNVLLEKVMELDFDGIIINNRFYLHTLVALEIARRKGIRPIVLEHGSDYLVMGGEPMNSIIKTYERAITSVVKSYDPAFYGVSQRAARWLVEFGIDAHGVVHNAIDGSAFRASASKRDVLADFGVPRDAISAVFVGRLVPEKGADVVAGAVEELNARGAHLHALIVGDGPERATLESLKSTCVHVTGPLDTSDVAALLLQSDLFLFPSRYPEGLPTVLLEAAVCETYIITSDVAGAREVVPDDSCGTVIDDPSVDSVADALSEALADRSRLASCARACAEHVERNLSWHLTAQAVYDACVADERLTEEIA